MSERKNILLIYDVDGWAWHGMARGILKYAPPQFDVTIKSENNCPRNRQYLSSFDAVLWFSWTSCPTKIHNFCQRLWTVIHHHGCQFQYNPDARWTPDVAATSQRNIEAAQERLPLFSGIIVPNRPLAEFVTTINLQTAFLPAAVDHQHWSAAPVSPDQTLRIGWCGQTAKQDLWHTTKGYCQVFQPLMQRLKENPLIRFQRNTSCYNNGALTSDEMVGWYHSFDVLLCTSSTEGSPLPVFEAAACGRPVVSTTVGGVPDLVADGKNGFLLGTFSDQQEAEQVVDLAEQRLLELANNIELRQQMSQNIRRAIEEQFTWERVSKQWLETLVSIASTTRYSKLSQVSNIFSNMTAKFRKAA